MIPVIINNRDLLTWPSAMLKKIRTYKGVGEIVIVDNDSSYPPLLKWYRSNPCKIIKVANLGHPAPWLSGAVASLKSRYYVVTDPDLGLDQTPDDTLIYLRAKLESLGFDKLGLGLDWEKVPKNSPYYAHIQSYEKARWQRTPIIDGVGVSVKVDTTFAIYKVPMHFIGGGSTEAPYIARHYPWELTKRQYSEHDEFRYYVEHANSSSTYKSFLKL